MLPFSLRISPFTLFILLLNVTLAYAGLASNPGDYNVIPCGDNKGKTPDCTARISNREAFDLRALRLRLQLFIRSNELQLEATGLSQLLPGQREIDIERADRIEGRRERHDALDGEKGWIVEDEHHVRGADREGSDPGRRERAVVMVERRDLRRSRAVMSERRAPMQGQGEVGMERGMPRDLYPQVR